MRSSSTLPSSVLRLLSGALAVLIAVAPSSASAQQRHTTQGGHTVVPFVGGSDSIPPGVTITPGTETTGTSPLPVTVDWCDNVSLRSHTILFNGVDVTSSFTYTAGTDPTCGASGRSTGTVTLTTGSGNALHAVALDNALNRTDSYATYTYTTATYGLSVTPDNQVDSAKAHRSNSVIFEVANTGNVDEAVSLTVTCTGAATGCPTSLPLDTVLNGSFVPETVTFQAGSPGDTGTVQLRATYTGNSAVTDVGSFAIRPRWVTYLQADYAFNDFDNQNVGLCANNCFTAAVAQSTVPYISLGQPRQVTLVYHGDRVAERPFVYSDVWLSSGAYSDIRQYWLEGQVNGVSVPFTNGENRLHFAADSIHPSTVFRLAGQLNLDGYTTGLDSLTLIVTAEYADHTEQASRTVPAIVVNERSSPVARGWTIGGVQHLYPQSDGTVLLTDGTGTALSFSCSTHTSPCASGTYGSPSGETSRLTVTGSGSSTTYTRAYPDSTEVVFNHLGQMTSVADRFGTTVSYGYDASGRVSTIGDPVRQYSGSPTYTCLWYGSSWGLDSIREPGTNGAPCQGRKTTFTVASDSTLRTIQDPDGHTTQLTYDASKRLASLIDRRGDTTTYAYNATTWKLDSILGPRVPVDTAGTGSTVMRRPVVRYTPWQARGVPLGPTDSIAAVPSIPDSMIAMVTDPEHHATRFTVDRWGEPVVTTDPLGRVTTVTRSGIFPVRVVYPSGLKDSAAYNSSGLVTYSAPAGVDPSTITYGPYALPTSVTGVNQPTQTFVYGANGRDSVVTAAGVTVRYYADALGRDTMTVDAQGHTATRHYESALGNLDSSAVLDSSGALIQYQVTRFDAYGRDSVRWASGQPADTTMYDIMNRVLRNVILGPGTRKQVTTFAYDALYRTQVTDAKSQVFRDSANALGWVIQHTDPQGHVIQYRYNRDGLVTGYTNRRGQTVAMTYDAGHRLTGRTGAQIVPATFSYNALGTITVGANNVSVDSIFTNAQTGWTDSVVTILAGTKRFKRSYRPNALQQLDSLGVTGPDAANSADLRGRRYFWNTGTALLDSVAVGDSVPEHFTVHYNDELLPDTITYPWGAQVRSSYSSTHRLTQVKLSPSVLDSLLSRYYGYDSLGRIIETDRAINGGTAAELGHYTYDPLGQLSSMAFAHAAKISLCTNPPYSPMNDYGMDCWDTAPKTMDRLVGFTYDSVGNMRVFYDSTHSYPTQGTFILGDRLTGWANNTYTYDTDGNRATKTNGSSTVTYHWTADGLLDSVIAGPSRIGYAYNAFGRLVVRSRNGNVERYFVWDQDHLLAELDSTASQRISEYVYWPGYDAPLAMLAGPTGSVHDYVRDALGSIVGVFAGASGGAVTLEDRYTYSPWGRMDSLATMLADTNRLRWKGLLWEGDSTQLYYVRARWYDPASNRFISEDPAGLDGGINPYLYGANEPVNRRDPSGMFFDTDCGFLFDCGSGFGGSAGGQYGTCSLFLPCNPGDITQGDLDPTITELKALMDADELARSAAAGLGSFLAQVESDLASNPAFYYASYDGPETIASWGGFIKGGRGCKLAHIDLPVIGPDGLQDAFSLDLQAIAPAWKGIRIKGGKEVLEGPEMGIYQGSFFSAAYGPGFWKAAGSMVCAAGYLTVNAYDIPVTPTLPKN